METTTPFDLNRAIQQWRETLAQSPAIRSENLDELEVHLRDSMSALEARGLAGDEAFLVATKRVGSSAVLGREFAKANSQLVWVERLLWAIVIMQLWAAVQSLGSSLAFLVRWAANFYPVPEQSEMDVWLKFPGKMIALPGLGIILLALLAWRFFNSSQSWLREKLDKLSSQPFSLAASLLVFSLTIHFVSIIVIALTVARHGVPLSYYFQSGSLGLELFYAGAVFVLARKRLLRKA